MNHELGTMNYELSPPLPPFGQIAYQLDGGVLDGEGERLTFLCGDVVAGKEAACSINITLPEQLTGIGAHDPDMDDDGKAKLR
jgi:hypothetical protein